MKKIVLVVAMIAVVALAGTAMAAGTNTLTINATVLNSCKFQNATSTLNFDLDPAAAGNVSFPTTIAYACTNGTPAPAISDDGGTTGTYTLSDGAGGTITYSVAYGATVAGTGLGNFTNLPVTVSVLGANYAAAAPGVYTDDLVITITP